MVDCWYGDHGSFSCFTEDLDLGSYFQVLFKMNI